MHPWRTFFVFTDDQECAIHSLLPRNAKDPKGFVRAIERSAQAYRPLAWYLHESGIELRPSELRPLLLRIVQKARGLRKDLVRLGALFGRGLIDSALDTDHTCQPESRVVDKAITILDRLAFGAQGAYEEAKSFKLMNPEHYLAFRIKREYAFHIGKPGQSRNCRCYKIVGLVLEFAGKPMKDWYHLYKVDPDYS